LAVAVGLGSVAYENLAQPSLEGQAPVEPSSCPEAFAST
jgi:hypothetical protein